MAYRVVVKMGSGAFFVPNEAVENLKLCTATQLKLLLLAFSRGFAELTPESASSELNISIEEAKDNLDYWVNRGILECDGKVQKAAVPCPAPQQVIAPAETKRETPEISEPKLTMQDIARLKKENPAVAFTLGEAERILGKTFTSCDTETVVKLITWAGVPPVVLVTVMEYCAGIGKGNLRYIKQTAINWLDNGVDTLEAAEEHMRELNALHGWEGEVKRALDIQGRSLVKREKELADSWKLYNIPIELIHFAYEKCIMNTGKRSFAYINKLLLAWHQKGFKTVAEAEAENRFAAEQNAPSFNLDELEQRMLLEDSVL